MSLLAGEFENEKYDDRVVRIQSPFNRGDVQTYEFDSSVRLVIIFQKQASRQNHTTVELTNLKQSDNEKPQTKTPPPGPLLHSCTALGLLVVILPCAFSLLRWAEQGIGNARLLSTFNIKSAGIRLGGRPKVIAVRFLSVLRKWDRGQGSTWLGSQG